VRAGPRLRAAERPTCQMVRPAQTVRAIRSQGPWPTWERSGHPELGRSPWRSWRAPRRWVTGRWMGHDAPRTRGGRVLRSGVPPQGRTPQRPAMQAQELRRGARGAHGCCNSARRKAQVRTTDSPGVLARERGLFGEGRASGRPRRSGRRANHQPRVRESAYLRSPGSTHDSRPPQKRPGSPLNVMPRRRTFWLAAPTGPRRPRVEVTRIP